MAGGKKKTCGGEGGEPPPACLAGGTGGKISTVEGGVGEVAAGVPRRRQAREERNGSREGFVGSRRRPTPAAEREKLNGTRGGGPPPASHAGGKGKKSSTVRACVREVVGTNEQGSTSGRRTACSYAVAGGRKHATREARTCGARARDRSPGGAPPYSRWRPRGRPNEPWMAPYAAAPRARAWMGGRRVLRDRPSGRCARDRSVRCI